jgi:hypothetical protein
MQFLSGVMPASRAVVDRPGHPLIGAAEGTAEGAQH